MLGKMRKIAKSKKILILAMALLLGSMPSVSHATNAGLAQSQQKIKDTQNKIEEVTNQKTEIENALGSTKNELTGLKKEEKNLKNRLDELNNQLAEVSEKLSSLEEQIALKELEIQITEENLAYAREKEAWQYDCMEKRIQYTYERGETDLFQVFFAAKSFSSFLNFATYLENIASYDDKMLDELVETREYIEEEEIRLNQEKEELTVLMAQAEAEKSKVTALISQTTIAAREYADQIEEVEKIAAAYEKEKKQLESDLKKLQKQLQEELALSQLAQNSQWRDISEVQFAEGDRYLLANLIYCEAGGEPYAGQVAVGAVVMNRVLSSKFPNTVVGVIYQKRQFSPVDNGRLVIALAKNKATPSCYKAADEAMQGITNVGNCLFFRTPIPGLTGINIGGHVFY